MISRIWIFLCINFLGFASLCFSLEEDKNKMNEPVKTQNSVVELKTNLGNITIELYSDKAPITVKNFLGYVNEGFYNHTIFHRVIDGFMIQGGGFTKEMNQKQTKAPIANEADNGLANKKWTVAMARTSDPNSATAQFFINVADNSFLDFKGKNPRDYGYCVFGKVIAGTEVLEKMKKVKTSSAGPHQNVPMEPIEILEAQQVS